MAKKVNDFAYQKAAQKLDQLLDAIEVLHDQMIRDVGNPYWQVDLVRGVCQLSRIADDFHSQMAVCIDRIDELSILVESLDTKYSDLLYHLSTDDE